MKATVLDMETASALCVGVPAKKMATLLRSYCVVFARKSPRKFDFSLNF